MPETTTTRQLILKMQVDLPSDVIESLIDAGGYGIGYWCRHAVVDSDAETYTVYPHRELVDESVPSTNVITYDRIRDALVELWDADRLPEWFAHEIRTDDIAGDAEVGDLIIQQAAFREIVFG